MKRKIIIALVVVVGLGGIGAMLMHNKALSDAKLKSVNDVQKAFAVTVTQVSKQQISEMLSMVGTTAPSNDVNVLSEAPGRITQMFVKVGQQVSAGTTLVQIDDELRQANVALAEVNLERAKKDFERYKTLSEKSASTEFQKDAAWQAFKTAESQLIIARRQLKDAKVVAPISGVVTARPVDVGAMVQGAPTNTLIANIVDISSLKVKVNVAEKDAFKLKQGDKVEITTDVYPSGKFEGRVDFISSKGDEAHTYPVEISFPNNARNPFKAGMFVRVNFSTIQHENALTIPREALVGSVKEPQVFVVENGIAKLRNLVIGSVTGTSIEVLQGVNEGETVVVNGQNNLKDNAQVTVIK